MPREKIRLTQEQIDDAKAQYKTYTAQAKYLGVSDDVYRRERKRLLRRKSFDDKVKYLTERDPKLELTKKRTIEALKKECESVYERSRKTIGYNEVTFDLGDDDCAVKLDCDWHIGNEMTNLPRWAEDIEITIKTPRLFTILNGDYTDNLDAISKGYESLITVPEAKNKVKDAVMMMGRKVLGTIQGCFLEGTPVVADDYTMKPIETIEKVLGSDKTYNVKKHWNDNYTKDGIYKISYMGNTVYSIHATADHPFYGIKRKNLICPYRKNNRFCKGINSRNSAYCKKYCKEKPNMDLDVILSENLEIGDFLYIPKPKDPRGNKFTMEDMEIFGWYLVEGSLTVTKNVVFSFGIKDLKYAKRIKKLIKKGHSNKISSISLKKRKNKNVYTLYVGGRDFANWIYKYCGRHSHSKKLHIDVINESNEKLAKLVDCFRLGNGHTRDNNGLDITLTTISEDLAWQLWNILLRIGEFASIRKQDRSKMSKNYKINGHVVKHNYDFFAINYRPHRKQFKFCETEKGYFVPITKIEFEEYEGNVKNLTVNSIEHLIRPCGVIVSQCHDEWFFKQDSWDISQYLADHSDGYWLGFRGKLNLKVGEQTYKIYTRHKYRRHSTDNLTWGMLYKFRKLKEPVDIMMSGHHHQPTIRVAHDRGQIVYLAMGGSYKPYDRFIEHRDIDEGVALMPAFYLRSDKHDITPFIDFRSISDYL